MNIKTEFTELECTRFREQCNFTPDEMAVFNLRVRAKSVVEIAMELHLSERTVDRRLQGIKTKIIRVL